MKKQFIKFDGLLLGSNSIFNLPDSHRYLDDRTICIYENNSSLIAIGRIGIFKHPVDSGYEIDMVIDKNFRNKGYGTKALDGYLNYIFQNTEIREIRNQIIDYDKTNKMLNGIKSTTKQVTNLNNAETIPMELNDKITNIINIMNSSPDEMTKRLGAKIKDIFLNGCKNTATIKLHEKLGFTKMEKDDRLYYTITKEQFLSQKQERDFVKNNIEFDGFGKEIFDLFK